MFFLNNTTIPAIYFQVSTYNKFKILSLRVFVWARLVIINYDQRVVWLFTKLNRISHKQILSFCITQHYDATATVMHFTVPIFTSFLFQLFGKTVCLSCKFIPQSHRGGQNATVIPHSISTPMCSKKIANVAKKNAHDSDECAQFSGGVVAECRRKFCM